MNASALQRSSSSAGAYGTRFFTELFRGQTSVPTLSDSQLNERRCVCYCVAGEPTR